MNIPQAMMAALGAAPNGMGLPAGAFDGATPETARAFAGALATLENSKASGLPASGAASLTSAVSNSPMAATPLAASLVGTTGMAATAGIGSTAPSADRSHPAPEQPSPAQLLAAGLLALLPSEVALAPAPVSGGATSAADSDEPAVSDVEPTEGQATALLAGMAEPAAWQTMTQQAMTQQGVAQPPAPQVPTSPNSSESVAAAGVSAAGASSMNAAAPSRNGSAAAQLTPGTPMGLPAQRVSSDLAGQAATAGATASDDAAAATPSSPAAGQGPATHPPTHSATDAAPGIALPAGMVPVTPAPAPRSIPRSAEEPGPAGAVAEAPPVSSLPASQAPAPLQVPQQSHHTTSLGHLPPNVGPQLTAQLGPQLGRLQNLGDGTHRMIIRIDPQALGPVRVVAEIQGGSLQVKLHASTEAGQAALQASFAEVRADLARIAPAATLDLGSGLFGQSRDQQAPADLLGSGSFQQSGDDRRQDRGGSDAEVPAARTPQPGEHGSPVRGAQQAHSTAGDHAVDVTA